MDRIIQIFPVLKYLNSSELLRGAGIAFSIRIFGLGIQYSFIYTIAKLTGAKGVGLFTIAFLILQMTGILSRLGIQTALLKLSSQSIINKEIKSLIEYVKIGYILILFTSLLASITLYFSSDFLAYSIFNNTDLSETLRLTSLAILPFSLLNINFEIVRGFKQIATYSILEKPLPYFIMVVVFLFLFSSGFNYAIAIGLGFAIAFYISFLVSLYSVKRNLPINTLRLDQPHVYIENLLRLSIPLLVVNIVSFSMGWIDTILLGIYLNEDTVGIYNICLRIALIISIPLMAVDSISAPKFAAEWANKDYGALRKVSKRSSKLIFILAFPLIVIISSFPKFFLDFFGSEFTEDIRPLIIVVIGQMVNVFCGSVGLILQMTKYQKEFQTITISALIINIFLSYLLIPRYGIIGSAISTSSCLIFWNVTSLLFIKVRLGYWVTFVLKD